MVVTILTYKKEPVEVMKHLAAHQEFLDRNYQLGKFITSGPQIPRTGGVILMNTTKEEAASIIEEDPFFQNEIADFEMIEFEPKAFDPRFEPFV